jgi:hypothetical protein
MTSLSILSKLISPKELGLLKNDFLKYSQFIEDIKKRMKTVGIAEADADIFNDLTNVNKEYKNIISILGFCNEISGRISGDYKNYYSKKYEYAEVLQNYIFGDISSYVKLKEFDCFDKKVYTDDDNPIIFSQIERSKAYGNDNIIKRLYEKCGNSLKVTSEDLKKYSEYDKDEKYKKYSNKGTLETQEEIEYMRKYTQLKNKVELNNIMNLSSMLYELFSHMVSWCYQWERDFEYFLLGAMYLKDKSRLNEIDSIYVYGKEVSIYGKTFKRAATNKVTGYLREMNKCENDKAMAQLVDDLFLKDRFAKEEYKIVTGKDGSNEFNSDTRVRLRNEIDHLEYFRKPVHSIIDYFNYFHDMLSYDRKLQNSVTKKFKNILESSNIVLEDKVIKFNPSKKSAFDTFTVGDVKSGLSTHKVKVDNNDKEEEKKVQIYSDEYIKAVNELLKLKD